MTTRSLRSASLSGPVTLPDRYDDGAYSGATLERPALKRLMTDVRAGRVDTIVVYKIDRLSRSLTLLSPGMVRQVLDGIEPEGVSLKGLGQSISAMWN